MSDTRQKSGRRTAGFDLSRFLPYRLAELADEVSQTIASVYVDQFDLSRHEWRILAWLGNHPSMAAKDVGRNAGLDKMQLSRALAGLEDKKLVAAERDAEDRRGNVLRLTRQGRAVYDKITPLALARENYLLSALTAAEAKALDTIMAKLLKQAVALNGKN
jgi:DNA-binding MarR family transcriptional regulator